MTAPPDTRPSRRTAGFRISTIDVAAILICGLATVAAWNWVGNLALIAPLALGHFFLFCNVFRIRRNYELVWAAIFIANCFYWINHAVGHEDGRISILGILAFQLPVTGFLIWKEMRSPRYHGIASGRINPQLELYLNGDIK